MSESEELREWARLAFRPAKICGSVAAVRSSALRAREPLFTGRQWVAVAATAAGALALGWWIGRRYRKQIRRVLDERENRYLVGALALGAL